MDLTAPAAGEKAWTWSSREERGQGWASPLLQDDRGLSLLLKRMTRHGLDPLLELSESREHGTLLEWERGVGLSPS